MNRIARLIANESGATTIEYAAVASLISIAAISAMGVIGTKVAALFASVPTF